MKILKKLLFVLLAIVALFLIVALFVDGSFQVERSITINKESSEVFDYVKNIQNQNDYGVWFKMDPNMTQDHEGEDGTVGFVSKWNSTNENVGKGEQEITKIVDGERIEMELRFIEPFEATNEAYMTTTPENGKTKVSWGITGKMDYPMNFFNLFMDMDEMLGKDLDGGLKNLKQLLESENSGE